MGVTDEIRELFKQGKTVKEIVAGGYKKPTVYKINKEFKTEDKPKITDSPDSSDIPGRLDNSDTLEIKEPEQEPDQESDEEPDQEPDNDEFNDDEKTRITELFGPGDDDLPIPFREFNDINIDRNSVDIAPIITQTVSGKITPCDKQSRISTTIAINEGFELIGILTGEDFWGLSVKEQKLIKKVCVLPGIDKYLSKFGVYGCALILVQILFKRIKLHLNVKSKDSSNPNLSDSEIGTDRAVPAGVGSNTGPADKSSHVMQGLGV